MLKLKNERLYEPTWKNLQYLCFTNNSHSQSSQGNVFWGHLIHNPHCLIFKTLLREIIPFPERFVQFSDKC